VAEEKREKPESKVKKLSVAKRRELVISLYKQCGNVRMVADRLNEAGIKISKSTVANDINAVFEELRKDTLAEAQHLRTLQYLRLNSVIVAFWKPVLEGDEKAAYVALKAMKQLDDLYGLPAPKQLEVKQPDARELLATLLGVEKERLPDNQSEA
jgi:hypothetical protein